MIRALILAALLLPGAALAQPAPAQFSVPAPTFTHVLAYLRNGGTIAEGQALADALVAMAQQQMATAQKAPAEPAK